MSLSEGAIGLPSSRRIVLRSRHALRQLVKVLRTWFESQTSNSAGFAKHPTIPTSNGWRLP